MTENERDNLILKIASDVEVIKHDLEHDYKALYGNGKPGLIAEVQELNTQVRLIKQSQAGWRQALHYIGSILSGGIVAWLTAKVRL